MNYTMYNSMEVIETTAKAWGNSIGVVIPKEIAEKVGIVIPNEIARKEHIKGGKKLKILIIKDSKGLLRKSFGSLAGRFKKSSQRIKDEIRAEFND